MRFKIFMLTLMLSTIVIGADIQTDSVKYRFKPIVVTATKVEGAQQDIAASVSVLDESIIQSAPTRSVMELVKDYVPGVYFTERSVMGYGVASGAAGGISIRGVGGSPVTGVLVLRDGRPDIMGMMGHPIPDAYSLDGVERVEVIRGPGSFLYGTNAMGGIINIISKRVQQDGFTTRFTGGVGSYNIQKLSGSHGGKIGALDYYLTAAVRKTDGHRDYSQYEGDFYTAHVGYKLSTLTSIEMNANLSNLNMDDPGPENDPFQNHWYDLQRSGVDMSLIHLSSLGESNLKIHGNFGEHKIYDGWRSEDYTVGLMFYHNIKPWAGNIATVGFDFKNYGGDASKSVNKIPAIDYGKKEMTEYAPYVHMQQMLLKRFIASAGVRLENHNLYGNQVLPKVGLVSHVARFTSLRLSAAKGFRSPSIRELYVFPPRNQQLEPEEMWNYEIGVTQELGRAQLDASLFRSEGSNQIQMKFPEMMFVNSGEFIHTGYEMMFSWFPVEALDFSASWSKLDLQDETLNSPGKKLTTSIGYRVGRFTLGSHVIFIQDLYGDNNRRLPMGDYTVVDINASVRIVSSLTLHMALKNVLDENYQTLYGYPMPGRMITGDLSYEF
ncbi:TonB-dependent receptor [candidate division KSB1 bacterium]|nr:TonB-dependent receptor [candidate division KSB1 bacterium]